MAAQLGNNCWRALASQHTIRGGQWCCVSIEARKISIFCVCQVWGVRNVVRWRHNHLLFHIFFEFEVVRRDSGLWEGQRFRLFWLPTCFLLLWVVFVNFSDDSRERFVRFSKRPVSATSSMEVWRKSYRLRLALRNIHEWWLQKHWDLPRPVSRKVNCRPLRQNIRQLSQNSRRPPKKIIPLLN